MMDKILTKWRRIPYLHSSLIWMLAILLSGDWLGGSLFQSDFRLRYAFMCIAASAVYFIHVLIYKHKTPAEVLVSLTVFTPVIALSVWLSLRPVHRRRPLQLPPPPPRHVRRIRHRPLGPQKTTPAITPQPQHPVGAPLVGALVPP